MSTTIRKFCCNFLRTGKRTALVLFIFCLPLLSLSQDIIKQMGAADAAFDAGNWPEAIQVLTDIYNAPDHRESSSFELQFTVASNLGYAHWQLYELEKAQSFYLEALEVKQEADETDDEEYVKTLESLGQVIQETGNYDRAIFYLEEAVETAASGVGKNTLAYAEALNQLAGFHNETGGLQRAYDMYFEAHTILKGLIDEFTPEFAESCGYVGRLLIKNGEFDQAEEYLGKSIDIYESLGKDYQIEYTEGLESLGVLYEIEGKYAESERILLKTLDIKNSIENLDIQYIIETLNDLGILYQHLGNYDRAEDYFNQVHDQCVESLGRENGYYAVAINNLATMADKQGDYQKAHELFSEALEVYASVHGKDHPLYADVLNNLASIESELGMFESGEQRYEEVLALDVQIYGKHHPNYATALNNYGILLFRKGEVARAEGMYLEALEIRRDVLGTNHPSYARSLENLGLYYYSQDDVPKAEQFFRDAIDVQKSQINDLFPVLTDNERRIFYETVVHDIERYNHIAVDLLEKRPELINYILNNQIQTKAILLNASEKVRRNILSSQDQELIANYRQWTYLKNELVRYYQIGKTKLAEYGINLKDLENEIDNLEKVMINSIAQFDAINSRQAVTWQDVQGALTEGQALVEIVKVRNFDKESQGGEHVFGFSPESIYLAIIVRSDRQPEYVLIENGYNLEEVHYPYYSNSLEYGLEDKDSFKYFWKDIDRKLDGVTQVYVSPDGVYHKLNPNILKVSSKNFLIDQYYVSYITNSTDLLPQSRIKSDYKRAYLIGNPNFNPDGRSRILARLPGSEQEINDIESVLQVDGTWDVRKYSDNRATESGLKSFFEPNLLHIATHGFFTENEDVISASILPDEMHSLFKSGLYLAGAESTYQLFLAGQSKSPLNDGILTAYEAMQLNLDKTDIVILSACNTGLGDIANGEGVYGLQRAFMVAGAKNLIISLTKIDDEATQKTMNYFYRYFQETNEIQESLKRAQLAIRNEYNNPYIWGSFILIGKGKES